MTEPDRSSSQDRLPGDVYARRRLMVGLVAVVIVLLGALAIARLGGGHATTATPSGPTALTPLLTDGGTSVTLPAVAPVESLVTPQSDPPVQSTQSASDGTAAAATSTASTVGTTTSTNPPPDVDAVSYAVFDTATGQWLAESQGDQQVAVGSVMKLLTAKVVMDNGDLAKVVTVPALQMDAMESAIGLYEGEQLPRDVLLRAMLIVSANDAARVLAVDVGGDQDSFVQQMNAKAHELGLSNTVASNPVGLDSSTAHSSAKDMATLAASLMQDETFRTTVTRPSANLHGQVFAATNGLLGVYPGADGIKTGHTTDAGYCLVGSATRDGRRVIVAVMGSTTEAGRVAAATALLDWAFAQT
jgi:D-alanyl-D-alanine carboxypeptidase